MNAPPTTVWPGMHAMARALQEEICGALERIDGRARFGTDTWQRTAGGGGTSRILQDGCAFEKAGVNVAEVHGTLSAEDLRVALGGDAVPGQQQAGFYATGLSLVVHPRNPMVPTAHANYRYFELQRSGAAESWWFGGGADLTPSYLFDEDAAHFHRVHKQVCDRFDPSFYPRFKRRCDEYFLIPHRGERRGVGGIFFERLHDRDPEELLAFVSACANAFLPAYLPIVQRRSNLPFSEDQRRWQQLRRGRYAEFNLAYDRGTLFGLKTGGRAESILMSLPPLARWAYDHHPAPGSTEACLVEVLRSPREWV
jgi:coproporphyrinogen III oxidase